MSPTRSFLCDFYKNQYYLSHSISVMRAAKNARLKNCSVVHYIGGRLAKFEYSDWLIGYFQSVVIFVFEWDSGNSKKSFVKHGITIEQIESCFYDDDILALGRQLTPRCAENRFGIIARDCSENILFVCFTIRSGKIRPISARVANKYEREIYEE